MEVVYNDEIKDYTEQNLIAYIGNKRRLINLIIDALKTLDISPENGEYTFYDPFAGTGVVSRLARAQGFKVICNDWEPYTYHINKTYIELNKSDLDKLFSHFNGINSVFNHLNNCKPIDYEDSYITKYYCPKNTENPDKKHERLFYTRENGERIDTIREEIYRNYENGSGYKNSRERDVLLASLLYEAATRANTSGVFKAFHNGFGGLGKDALTRIMKPLQISIPKLIDSKVKSKVFCKDATRLTKRLCKRLSFDITYLDPPYNQHQYGSNYHLLNTIALNDKPKINKSIVVDGKVVDKSAIRKDWKKTKSLYCYKTSAKKEFQTLLNHLKSRYILVSYSVDGIIPFDDLLEMLSKKGKLSLVTSEYVKYRGGRQASSTKVTNIEFILIIDTSKKSNSQDILSIKNILLNQRFWQLSKMEIDVDNVVELDYKLHKGTKYSKTFFKKYDEVIVYIITEDDYRISDIYFLNKPLDSKNDNSPLDIEDLDYITKNKVIEDLARITEIDNHEKMKMILKIVNNLIIDYPKTKDGEYIINKIKNYLPKIPFYINKFNSPKAYPEYLKIKDQIDYLNNTIEQNIPSLQKSSKFSSTKKALERIYSIKDQKIAALQTN